MPSSTPARALGLALALLGSVVILGACGPRLTLPDFGADRRDGSVNGGLDGSVDQGRREGVDLGPPPSALVECEFGETVHGLATRGSSTAGLFDVINLGDGFVWVVLAERNGAEVRWLRLTTGDPESESFDSSFSVRSVAVTGGGVDTDPWISAVESRDGRPTVVAGRPFSVDFEGLMNPADTGTVDQGGLVDSVRTEDGQLLFFTVQPREGAPRPFRLLSLRATAFGLGQDEAEPTTVAEDVGAFRARRSSRGGAWVTVVGDAGEDGFQLMRYAADGGRTFNATVAADRVSGAPAVATLGADDDRLVVGFTELTAGVVPRVTVARLRLQGSSTADIERTAQLTPSGAARGTDIDLAPLESFQVAVYREFEEGDDTGRIRLMGLLNGAFDDEGEPLFGPLDVYASASTQGAPVRVTLNRNGSGWVIWADIEGTQSFLRARELCCGEDNCEGAL
ncbi:MAG: hypothetical protein ACFCGT_11805 [Sandaracinaceae bacterium]